ncbi:hypothetical protein VTK26DRAFT_6359 [Humicola hyalothermophila]
MSSSARSCRYHQFFGAGEVHYYPSGERVFQTAREKENGERDPYAGPSCVSGSARRRLGDGSSSHDCNEWIHQLRPCEFSSSFQVPRKTRKAPRNADNRRGRPMSYKSTTNSRSCRKQEDRANSLGFGCILQWPDASQMQPDVTGRLQFQNTAP